MTDLVFNLHTCSMQELFDYITRGLLKQGRPSAIGKEGSFACLYRGPNGLKCAAGLVLPDEFYRPDMEGAGISSIRYFENLTMEKHDLLQDLQGAHDNTARVALDSLAEWKELLVNRLEQLAKQYGLQFAGPEFPFSEPSNG